MKLQTETPLWVADYDSPSSETDALPPWLDKHVQTDIRIRVVDAVDVPGAGANKPSGKALRVELQDGGTAASEHRSEVLARYPTPWSTSYSAWPDPAGSERWYSYNVFVPTDFVFATDSKWLTITQLKGCQGGSPPFAIEINKSNFRFGGTRANNLTIPDVRVPITKGSWTNITFGIKLANDNTGWVEGWVNGVNSLTRVTGIATLDTINNHPDPIYLKQGLYRDPNWTNAQVLYFGPTKIGTSKASVS
jgi:hypothetical protein